MYYQFDFDKADQFSQEAPPVNQCHLETIYTKLVNNILPNENFSCQGKKKLNQPNFTQIQNLIEKINESPSVMMTNLKTQLNEDTNALLMPVYRDKVGMEQALKSINISLDVTEKNIERKI
jgi:hypothetical protein